MEKIRVVVGFVFKHGKLLLIKHKRKNIWLPVGGHVEKGESDREALLREIKEEVGLFVKTEKDPFFILEEPKEITPHFVCLYKSGEININPNEILDYKWFTKEEIVRSTLNTEVKNLSLNAFRYFEMSNNLKGAKIKRLILVAHPDDEIIWFSSLLKKSGSCLVICFDNIPYDHPRDNLDYAKKIERVLKEYKEFIPIIWFRIPKVTKPRIFGNIEKEILGLLEINIKSLLDIIKPEEVYTHNPWGEYGHSEHKAIHDILKKFRRDIIFPEAVINNAKNSEEYKKNISKISFFTEIGADQQLKEKFTEIYNNGGLWTMKNIQGYPLTKERFFNYKTDKIKAFLLASDDNYIKGLIAQINSIHKHFNNFRIYLIHNLSKGNLLKVKDFIYKEKKYEDIFFDHLEDNKGHITKINFAKFCPDFIEEESFFYMDTDVIILKEFEWENVETISCDYRIININKEKKYGDSIRLMQRYVLHNNGLIENGDKLKIFSDGAFFANKKWLIETLRPLIIKSSQNMPQAEKHWYGLGFFNAAIDILKRPVKKWDLIQVLVGIDDLNNLQNANLIHFVGKEKPWVNKEIDLYDLWGDYYSSGTINKNELHSG